MQRHVANLIGAVLTGMQSTKGILYVWIINVTCRAGCLKKTSVTGWVFMIMSPGDALNQTLVNHTR